MRKDLVMLDPHALSGYTFNWKKAYKYAKLMESGISFPPIRVHQLKNGDFIIKNGMHRTIASRLCGLEVLAEIASIEYSDDDYFEDLESNFRI